MLAINFKAFAATNNTPVNTAISVNLILISVFILSFSSIFKNGNDEEDAERTTKQAIDNHRKLEANIKLIGKEARVSKNRESKHVQ